MKVLNLFLLVMLTSASTATSANNTDDNTSEVATIVFMRSSFVGSMIKASIYEVNSEGTIFIGILKNKKKIEYQTSGDTRVNLFMLARIIPQFSYPGTWKLVSWVS